MGNLSCVSCRDRDDSQKHGSKTQQAHFKRSYRPTARTDDVIDNRVQTQAENARRADVMRNKINRPSSAAKSSTKIDPLLTSLVRDGNIAMSDEEVAATAIVQMTLFIATQVMYPAIERYLQETIARELELLSEQ